MLGESRPSESVSNFWIVRGLLVSRTYQLVRSVGHSESLTLRRPAPTRFPRRAAPLSLYPTHPCPRDGWGVGVGGQRPRDTPRVKKGPPTPCHRAGPEPREKRSLIITSINACDTCDALCPYLALEPSGAASPHVWSFARRLGCSACDRYLCSAARAVVVSAASVDLQPRSTALEPPKGPRSSVRCRRRRRRPSSGGRPSPGAAGAGPVSGALGARCRLLSRSALQCLPCRRRPRGSGCRGRFCAL